MDLPFQDVFDKLCQSEEPSQENLDAMNGPDPHNLSPLPVLPISASLCRFILCITLVLLSLCGVYIYHSAKTTVFLHRERIADRAAPGTQFKVILKPGTTTAFLVLGSKSAGSISSASMTFSVADTPEQSGISEPATLDRPCNWLDTDAEKSYGCIVKDLADHLSLVNDSVVWVTLPSGLPEGCALWLVSTGTGI
jgi:hypothetical protein